ncbi:MAG: universal stress protein [Planctomycetes bacterium]|nr:universal stress protein [Planctomycetota bacterium]MCP4770756.1 universal stress protein [Planctomycetota bacterium]MCP4862173.1 universal stress protein [Planctomycetota bacterium]
MIIKHILLTTDLSDESQRTFENAVALAKTNDARITLLNVVEDLKVAPHGAPLAPPIGDPEGPALVAAAEASLRKQSEALGSEINVTCKAILGTSIGEAVADYANDNDCDIILISTHGRTGFRRLVLGSIADEVLRHAHVPVLCFPRAK